MKITQNSMKGPFVRLDYNMNIQNINIKYQEVHLTRLEINNIFIIIILTQCKWKILQLDQYKNKKDSLSEC